MTDQVQSAQAAYADMLRLEIAPRLRVFGFAGSGSSYVLPADDRWQIVAFQKDYHSRAELLRFTVNLTVADKAAWEAVRAREASLPGRPSGNTRYGPVTSVIRLGLLVPPLHEDLWWEVVRGRPTGATATRILDAIERYALPWFRDQAALR